MAFIQLERTDTHLARLSQIVGGVKRVEKRFKAEAVQILVEGNRIDRLAGLDARGRPLRPVKYRVGRYEGASGPPLAPFRESSWSVRGFFAEWRGNVLAAFFRGEGIEFLAYHAAGKSGKGRPVVKDGKIVGFRGIKGATTGIVRDVFGVSARTRRDLVARFRELHRETFAGRVGAAVGRVRSFFGGLFS